ncbi:hypothetical protein [Polaromonas sp. C04]|uniref:AcrVA2 family anti-CRISPR protein n=1 Tax=Polaromonas sp. C04 TaxID=1945857 RepID=UPI0009859CF9|nr:hypothetical protein [Polaromonas sp. C04]OOG53134.1 hypothetical protein B0E49_11695 [Polaromonas sp. C04]
MTKLDSNACRPRNALVAIAREYPDAWKQIDEFRADRGKGLPTWPDWCFFPLAGTYAIVSKGSMIPLGLDKVGDVSRLGALGAWRVTQGIYRFDPTVFDAVKDTPVERDIPCDVLYHLPEWCIYIETPGLAWGGDQLHGVWVHLEYDMNDGRHELRMLTDADDYLSPIILHLGQWPLKEAIERVFAESQRHGLPKFDMSDDMPQLVAIHEQLLSLVLYVCSQASEIGDRLRTPSHPAPTRVKGGGWRLFPPNRVTTWDVGVRLGAALRKANQVASSGHGEPRNGLRGHIRRAHWHGFLSGPLKREDGSEIATRDRKFELRWLPPIAVNLDDVADLPATIRAVK